MNYVNLSSISFLALLACVKRFQSQVYINRVAIRFELLAIPHSAAVCREIRESVFCVKFTKSYMEQIFAKSYDHLCPEKTHYIEDANTN